jgi:type I restriction enzyme R subunit
LTALQVLYAGVRPLKISLADLRKLRKALEAPPLNARPESLWRAFQAVDGDKVKGTGGKQLADLVALVEHALKPETILLPYADEVRGRYEKWLAERDAANRFTIEQREWLDRMAEHIATSLRIVPADFDAGWFGQHGSLGTAHSLFGEQLHPLMAELNEVLAA